MKRSRRFKRVAKSIKPIQLNDPNINVQPDSITVKDKSKPRQPKTPVLHSVPNSNPLSFEKSRILPSQFFQIDALDLAPRLLGKFLRRDDVILQITEFGPGGHAYVYLCYGLHTMLNVVADKEGVGAAVLIRSCAPISGLDTIQQRRGQKTEKPVLLTGPGKIGQALGISTEWSSHPLYSPGGLELLDGPEPKNILVGPRIGIEYALPEHVNALWRFAIADTPWISAPKNTLRPP
ncbi:DNA-3-methyladenine glycosylase isoform X2 [Ricinus communis]|uniref:DNA-3-methyladenine glycosylase isoform X2 n=1 Tax=Ricinus communis TaxID=3988 RepID=UPI00077266BC|nr:DNA-3-methyladenine glycosylase isoform X2 [Ricinus communis]|eukprot:XP_015581593.1 DNA-3-methyladenine glycosylase isoform X2 [Ricinus communis]